MILDTMIAFLFGFPGAFLSLLASAIGIVKNKYWLSVIGALLFVPFTYYMYGSPGLLRGLVVLLPLFQIGSAAAVFQNKRTLAWFLLSPSILMVLWVLGVVLVYSFGIKEGIVY